MVIPSPEIYLCHYIVMALCASGAILINLGLLQRYLRNMAARKNDCIAMMIAFTVVNTMYAVSTLPHSLYSIIGWRSAGSTGFTATGIYWTGVPSAGLVNGVDMMRTLLTIERCLCMVRPFEYQSANKRKSAIFSFLISIFTIIASWAVYGIGQNTDHGVQVLLKNKVFIECWSFGCYLQPFALQFYYIANYIFCTICILLSIYFIYRWNLFRRTIIPSHLYARHGPGEYASKKRTSRINIIFAFQLAIYLFLEILPSAFDIILLYGYDIRMIAVVGPLPRTLMNVDSCACAILYGSSLKKMLADSPTNTNSMNKN